MMLQLLADCANSYEAEVTFPPASSVHWPVRWLQNWSSFARVLLPGLLHERASEEVARMFSPEQLAG